jgi:hypothetical protein
VASHGVYYLLKKLESKAWVNLEQLHSLQTLVVSSKQFSAQKEEGNYTYVTIPRTAAMQV